MKTFVVAYIDWFDYNLKMTDIRAESEIRALYIAADYFGLDTSDLHTIDPKEFKQFCFNCDCMMEAYEI